MTTLALAGLLLLGRTPCAPTATPALVSWMRPEPTASGRPWRGPCCASHSRRIPFGTKITLRRGTRRVTVTVIDRTSSRSPYEYEIDEASFTTLFGSPGVGRGWTMSERVVRPARKRRGMGVSPVSRKRRSQGHTGGTPVPRVVFGPHGRGRVC